MLAERYTNIDADNLSEELFIVPYKNNDTPKVVTRGGI